MVFIWLLYILKLAIVNNFNNDTGAKQ